MLESRLLSGRPIICTRSSPNSTRRILCFRICLCICLWIFTCICIWIYVRIFFCILNFIWAAHHLHQFVLKFHPSYIRLRICLCICLHIFMYENMKTNTQTNSEANVYVRIFSDLYLSLILYWSPSSAPVCHQISPITQIVFLKCTRYHPNRIQVFSNCSPTLSICFLTGICTGICIFLCLGKVCISFAVAEMDTHPCNHWS